MRLHDMDETVNNFLKEINKIAPTHKPTSKKHKECDWQECFDETSGFPYYWNVKTDQVTWEVPPEYKDFLEKRPLQKLHALSIKPPVPEDAVRIYKISEESVKIVKYPTSIQKPIAVNNVDTRTVAKLQNDVKEKKSILVTYGSGSESEDDEHISVNELKKNDKISSDPQQNNKVSNSAEENKTMPDALEKAKKITTNIPVSKSSTKKVSSGFALVAGYGGDSDDDQNDTVEADDSFNSPKLPDATKQTSSSLLFPIAPVVDVTQFDKIPEKIETVKVEEQKEAMNVKAFQRKRRIDVPLILPVDKKARNDEQANIDNNNDKTSNDETNKQTKSVQYTGFCSGGILFAKSEDDSVAVNPTDTKISNYSKEKENINKQAIDSSKDTLKEKLLFLSEGRETVSAVQMMIIQMDTLYEAYKSDNLRPSYLENWLEDMCMELIKLEKEATPTGWLLQWDRSEKRYFYCNIETGQTQWHYPDTNPHNTSSRSSINSGDDAMDISTTPPPPDDDKILEREPPPPPKIDRMVTPPPPIISSCTDSTADPVDLLPPGVSKTDDLPTPPISLNNESMTSVLTSFYSDIAAIESSAPEPEGTLEKNENIEAITPAPIKKKKPKVKFSHGLAMKKKGVSKLVEKWKHLQNNYD